MTKSKAGEVMSAGCRRSADGVLSRLLVLEIMPGIAASGEGDTLGIERTPVGGRRRENDSGGGGILVDIDILDVVYGREARCLRRNSCRGRKNFDGCFERFGESF